jgi:hypothetical protein
MARKVRSLVASGMLVATFAATLTSFGVLSVRAQSEACADYYCYDNNSMCVDKGGPTCACHDGLNPEGKYTHCGVKKPAAE